MGNKKIDSWDLSFCNITILLSKIAHKTTDLPFLTLFLWQLDICEYI